MQKGISREDCKLRNFLSDLCTSSHLKHFFVFFFLSCFVSFSIFLFFILFIFTVQFFSWMKKKTFFLFSLSCKVYKNSFENYFWSYPTSMVFLYVWLVRRYFQKFSCKTFLDEKEEKFLEHLFQQNRLTVQISIFEGLFEIYLVFFSGASIHLYVKLTKFYVHYTVLNKRNIIFKVIIKRVLTNIFEPI